MAMATQTDQDRANRRRAPASITPHPDQAACFRPIPLILAPKPRGTRFRVHTATSTGL
jgi:hypothetical protein